MSDWSVEIVRVSHPDFDHLSSNDQWTDRIDDALDVLLEYSPSASIGPDLDRYSIRLVVEAADFVPAMERGETLVMQACDKAGLPSWPALHVEATEWNEFERMLDEPSYPGLLGVSELAGLLDVSRQRASELARLPHFPQPIAQLKSGPVWDDSMVKRFVSDWKRTPGRPRKVLSDEDTAALEAIGQAARNWDKETLAGDHPGYPG